MPIGDIIRARASSNGAMASACAFAVSRFTLASSLALQKLWPASQALRLLAITNPMPPRIASEDAVRRTVIPSPSTNAPPSAVITGTLNCTDAPCVGVRPGIAAYQIV